MKSFIADPSDHQNFGFSPRWKQSKKWVPKNLDDLTSTDGYSEPGDSSNSDRISVLFLGDMRNCLKWCQLNDVGYLYKLIEKRNILKQMEQFPAWRDTFLLQSALYNRETNKLCLSAV
jgi:hypothetical protein